MANIQSWSKPRLIAARKLWLARLAAARRSLATVNKIRTSLSPRTTVTPQRKIELLGKWKARIAKSQRMVSIFDAEIARRNPVRIDEWLTGNVTPIRDVKIHHRAKYRKMLRAAADAARSIDRKLPVSSSYRSIEQERANWAAYKAGKGPIAAYPGTSLHGKGRALDLPDNEGEPGVRDDVEVRRALEARGFRFDVASEGWHASYYG